MGDIGRCEHGVSIAAVCHTCTPRTPRQQHEYELRCAAARNRRIEAAIALIHEWESFQRLDGGRGLLSIREWVTMRETI